MNKLNLKTIYGLGLVALVIIAVSIYSSSKKENAPPTYPVGEEANLPSSASPTTSQKSTTAPAPQVSVLSPSKSEKWALKTVHTIRWSNAGGVKGQVYLVSASGQTIGWIVPETAPYQTSFDWSTAYVSTNRYGGLRKDVAVGDYFIEVKFDIGKIPAARSGLFSIVYPQDIKPTTYNVSIKNYVASPSSISLKKGDLVVITNNDSSALTLSAMGRGTITIQPGQSTTIDTSTFFVGTYSIYSEMYPSLNVTVKVQ